MKYFIIWWKCNSDTRSMFEQVQFSSLEECTNFILRVLQTPCSLDSGRVVAMNDTEFTDEEYEYVCVNAVDCGWRSHHDIIKWK